MAILGVAALALRPSVARAEGCVVHGEDVILENVVGPVPGFGGIDLVGTRASARIPATARGLATVVVHGAIAFKGKRGNIWYTIARPVTLVHGMVALEVGAQVVGAHAGEGGVIASAVMRTDDVLPGEDKDPEEIIRGLRLPCAALTLDQPPDREADDEGDDAKTNGDGSWWREKKSARRVTLRAEPRANAMSLTLATIVEGQQFVFERITEDGPWMRVIREGPGVKVTGWLRRADLEATDGPEAVSGGCTGDHGPGLSGRGWGGKPPATLYRGPARVRVGARLDFGGWSATVLRADDFDVWVYETGEGKAVEVTRIPGVAPQSPVGPSVSFGDVTPAPAPKGP